MKTYTLYQLTSVLVKMKQGDLFKIKGQLNTWVFYDENINYFFVKNTICKQMILIQKFTN
jgi:hypothetical protein